MDHRRWHIGEIVCLAAAAAACLWPLPWLAVPGALLLLLWLPGLSMVRLLRLPTMPGRAWVGLALSFAMMPVGLHWLWQISNARWLLLAVLVGVNLALQFAAVRWGGVHQPVTALIRETRQRWLLAGMVLWASGTALLGYWVPMAGGRILSNPSGDYIKHHAVVWSLVNHPLPLQSIFYAGEPTTPYYYYEQFYLIPATFRILGGSGLSIALAFGLAAAIGTAIFILLVFLIARTVLGSNPPALLAVACVSVVGGWDAVPAAARWALSGAPVVVLDSWCPVAWRIHNLLDNFFWCPQHVAAAGVLLLCAYLLQQAPHARWWLVIAPLSAAAVFGESVYHAIIFFPAAAIFALLELRKTQRDPRGHGTQLGGALSLIAVVALVLMWSRIGEYREMAARFQGGLTLHWDRFELALLGRLLPPGPLANLLDAPWMALIDFGLGGLACVLIAGGAWRRMWADAGLRLLILAGGLGVACMWVVRSDVNPYDYGFRLASIPAMVVTAIAAGFLLIPEMTRPSVRRWRRAILVAGVLLGSPIGWYEAPGLALRTLVESKPEAAEAGALSFVREQLPLDAVVQADPGRVRLPQLFDRRMGVVGPDDAHVNVLSPRNKVRMLDAARQVRAAFAAPDARKAHDLLARWSIQYILVGPAERERYRGPGPFADRAWFRKLFDDGRAAVYELTGPVSDTQTSARQE